MSNQNIVPRSDKSGSLGTATKSWGTGSFHRLILRSDNNTLSGSFSGSFSGDGSNLTGTVPTNTVSSSAQLAGDISGS